VITAVVVLVNPRTEAMG